MQLKEDSPEIASHCFFCFFFKLGFTLVAFHVNLKNEDNTFDIQRLYGICVYVNKTRHRLY